MYVIQLEYYLYYQPTVFETRANKCRENCAETPEKHWVFTHPQSSIKRRSLMTKTMRKRRESCYSGWRTL